MKIFERLLELIYPSRCLICGELIGDKNKRLCSECDENLPVIEAPVCRFCGREKYKCGCGNERHIFSGIVSPYYYEDRMKRGIYRLKYQGIDEVNNFFADKMVKVILREYPNINFDFVTCVPMHKDSLRQRRYNPAEVLAVKISEELNLEFFPCLEKIYKTKYQHKLSKSERKGNVLGVYDINGEFKVAGKSVLLIDDITTTGATLDECAKMLRLAGAKSIYCSAAAATINKKTAVR